MSKQTDKTDSWLFTDKDFESLGTGKQTIVVDVYARDGHNQELGTAQGTFDITLGKEAAGNLYSFKTARYSVEIPNYTEYADGIVGGMGTVTFGTFGKFTCDMYVHRKFAGAGKYDSMPDKIRATPNTGNVVWQLGPVYIDNMSNWEMNWPTSDNLVLLEIKHAKISLNINNKPLQMTQPGQLKVEVRKEGVLVSTPQYTNTFTWGSYTIPNADFTLTTYSVYVQRKQGWGTAGEINGIWYKYENGKFSFDYASPADFTEKLKKEGFR
jgi:hypothetical protein